jgi:hypothetical protein
MIVWIKVNTIPHPAFIDVNSSLQKIAGPYAGRGVFAKTDIPKGTYVTTYEHVERENL